MTLVSGSKRKANQMIKLIQTLANLDGCCAKERIDGVIVVRQAPESRAQVLPLLRVAEAVEAYGYEVLVSEGIDYKLLVR